VASNQAFAIVGVTPICGSTWRQFPAVRCCDRTFKKKSPRWRHRQVDKLDIGCQFAWMTPMHNPVSPTRHAFISLINSLPKMSKESEAAAAIM
jgi:hypothetical protein